MAKSYGEIAKDLIYQRHQDNMLLHQKGGEMYTCKTGTYNVNEVANHELGKPDSDATLLEHKAYCSKVTVLNDNTSSSSSSSGGKYMRRKSKYRKSKYRKSNYRKSKYRKSKYRKSKYRKSKKTKRKI